MNFLSCTFADQLSHCKTDDQCIKMDTEFVIELYVKTYIMFPRLNLGSTTASPLQPETPELLLLPSVMVRTARSNEGSCSFFGIAATIPINTKMNKLPHLKFWKIKKSFLNNISFTISIIKHLLVGNAYLNSLHKKLFLFPAAIKKYVLTNGQLISKCPFDVVLVSSFGFKIPTKKLTNFCPRI